ncbi:oligopeptide transporter 4-like [Gossypium australe]|uniref:Oligopeptide transporter 4-like n=1 Tax=Gossypium australe TaxID=47621 RepID=A0A5B6VDR4_9ROSI|nr:oligopeptide transporter 4-like [Gossypium australe]
MAHNETTLRDYVLPNLEMVQGSIIRPAITSNSFEIKPTMIQMIQNNLQFRGTMAEDPNYHLKRFMIHLNTMGSPMKLFIFDSLAPGSIMTWDEFAGKFLQKFFFLIIKTIQLRRKITTFK